MPVRGSARLRPRRPDYRERLRPAGKVFWVILTNGHVTRIARQYIP
jgi:hypothetical protein